MPPPKKILGKDTSPMCSRAESGAKMGFFRGLGLWILLSCLVIRPGDGFYLPGSYPHRHPVGSALQVKVNSLTSIDTEMPFSYYSLPFCRPQEGIKDSAENLGELLMGDRIENSPYRFKMFTNESDIFTCRIAPLSAQDLGLLKKRIDEMYQINLILENLPAIRYTKKDNYLLRWTGYPVGIRVGDSYFLFNHLKFTVLVHKYEETNVARVMGTGDAAEAMPDMNKARSGSPGWTVVGFEVVPCSFGHDVDSAKNLKMYQKYPAKINCDPTTVAMMIKENQHIVFTYEVAFVESDIRWPSRWDAYLKMEGAKVHWFSILNSLMVITFLAGIVFVILLRTVRRDLTRYEELDKEAQAQMNEELSGWKLVVGDVFRAPRRPLLLCVMVGDGVQILGMAVVTILFAALGFMSPAARGTLITGMLFFYLFLGIAAGYVAVRLWKTLKFGDHSGWMSVSWRVACFFPGIAFFILTTLNFLLWGSHSTGAIPISLFVVLLLLWFCISVPLTLVGGFLGAKAPHLEYPVRTNQIPRQVPPQKYPSWLLVIGAGTLPFGTLFIELFFIMSSIWMGRVYYVFGFLFIVLILLVVVCAEVSLVLTYMHLCVEDWKWWWKSFFSSGSVAIYIFLYSVNYLVSDLKSLSGPISATLYLGYSLLMVIAIMLATGTIGFISSFWFVHYLFSSVKLD
ncbi:transmembrane 9 superfamily member 11-like [Canna indica]|uniref:Transmembrane 9 superfamily member n=1 Tax=Canna indica TaxID=4628 RepID=A0AAQ3JQ67_9LILI|nr:transmembrane 9 superfamily member 11-like [Canna indica]